MPTLERTTTVITGASSGIGRAIAIGVAEAGGDVALVGRAAGRLKATAEAVAAAGRHALVIGLDLTSDDAPGQVRDRVLERFGRVDALVHCAGLFLTGPVQSSAELLDRQWQTNVRAPYRLTIATLPTLRESRGSIVFLSSIAGHIGFPASSAYCATKGAVELMTKAIAVEEAPHGVRVNAIAPGNVETPMNAELMADPDYKQAMLAATPLGRNGRPEDIVPLALLLIGPGGRWMTGHSVIVDGGWTAR